MMTQEELARAFDEYTRKPDDVPKEVQDILLHQLIQQLRETTALATRLRCCRPLHAKFDFALSHLIIDALWMQKAVEENLANGQPT